ncbi:MAG: hypothetical protein MK186_12995 [Henriciella sp.]|nr:hypothetical protein [Henriciella sp.]
MADTVLTIDDIHAEALAVLENQLGIASKVYRAYEDEFDKRINGYKIGETLSIRKPTDYVVREGATAQVQDAKEGKTSITVDKQRGVDFDFTSKDMTLKIDDFRERFIEPAMIQLANHVDVTVMSLYKDVPNWVGTPGEKIDSFDDFYTGIERLNEYAVPMDMRTAVLSPADHAAMLGSQTSLPNVNGASTDAYRRGQLGLIGDVDTWMSQNVPTHIGGTRVGGSAQTALVDGAITSSTITYDDVKDTNVQTIHIDTVDPSGGTFKKGDVLTIEGVYAVNPVGKEPLPFLKQFTVTADETFTGTEGDLVISPAMIWEGAFKNVDVQGVSDLDGQDVEFVGAASTGYRQNMILHKNAFALVVVPMEKPQGAVNVSRKSYKGISTRMIPVYDGVNDVDFWRLDLLMGTKAIDPRLATRLSGTGA